ncbi:DMT family transporter [Desulfosporosinus fructosivorans]
MEQLKGKLYLMSAFALAGTSVIAARFVTGHLGTFTITATSLLLAILALLPLCRRNLRKTIPLMSVRDWVTLLLQALCGIFLFRMFLLQGLLHTSSGEAGVLTGATPAATTVFAWLLLKEPLSTKSLFGILSTIAGILLLQGILVPGNALTMNHLIGNILVLCAAVSESLFNILSRISSLRIITDRSNPLNPIVQTMLVSAIALLLCLIPALFEHPVLSLMSLGIIEWLALVWYGIFVTALAFMFWYAGIKRCTAYTAAAFSGMMPLTSLVLSVLLLGEHIGWHQWSGGLLVMLGMLLIGGCQTSMQPTKLLDFSTSK